MFWVWSLGSLLNRFRTLGSFRCSIRWPPLSWTTSRIRTKKHPAMMTKGIKTDKAMAVLIPAFRRLYTFWADEVLVLNPLTLQKLKQNTYGYIQHRRSRPNSNLRIHSTNVDVHPSRRILDRNRTWPWYPEWKQKYFYAHWKVYQVLHKIWLMNKID